MKEYKDIKDDQIRIIGEDDRKKSPFRHPRVIILAICVLLLIGGGILFVIMNREKASETEPEPSYFEPEATPERSEENGSVPGWIPSQKDSPKSGTRSSMTSPCESIFPTMQKCPCISGG